MATAQSEPTGPANSPAGGSDQQVRAREDALLARYADGLAAAVAEALPAWVADAAARRLSPEELAARSGEIAEAAEAAVSDVGRRVAELLALDIDEQWTNPLTVIRSAIRYPNDVLRNAGVAPAERDEQAMRFLPDDVYDLAPANFAALGPEVHEFGISWGAAKAHVHLRRRRDEEQI